MTDLPSRANCIVIGGGIVGNSLLGWLAELGWTDLVQLDKGPFPNPGGSTGHASNFIFPVDHSKEMTQLPLDSDRQDSGACAQREAISSRTSSWSHAACGRRALRAWRARRSR